MSMFLDVSEVGRFAADLGKVAAGAVKVAHAAVAKTALDIERDAKIAAPVDTGNLRNSISHEIRAQGGLSGGSIIAAIGPTAEYGAFVEYGTSRMSPQPYLGPAFDRHVGDLDKALLSVMDGL